MTQSIVEIARAAMAAYEATDSFEATEIITAGSIRVEARVRHKKSGKITVEYRSYQDHLAEFEERYIGGAEFVADELIGMQLVYDGNSTWIYDAKNNVATRKLGRRLYSPLRGVNALAEIGFLRDLTRDFLLQDGGEETIGGRPAYRLNLKPKVRQRQLLLKEEGFPIKKATVALDQETLFPLRIEFYPGESSILFYLVGPSTPITIEYKDLRLEMIADERFSFTPSDGMRVFTEESVLQEAFAEKLPFAVPLAALNEHGGYSLYDDRATVTINEEGNRAYAMLALISQEGEADNKSGLSLRVGNYLSLGMNRRRALLAEQGELISLGDIQARFLDRGALVKEQLPETMERSVVEVGWERDGVHWFLLGEGMEKEALIDAANVIIYPQKTEPVLDGDPAESSP